MDTRSCANSEIACPKYGECSTVCNDRASCKESIIYGPIDNDLSINCNGVNACFSSIFDATQSSKLNITGCEQDGSCLDLAIYCPPMTTTNYLNYTKNCIIQGMVSMTFKYHFVIFLVETTLILSSGSVSEYVYIHKTYTFTLNTQEPKDILAEALIFMLSMDGMILISYKAMEVHPMHPMIMSVKCIVVNMINIIARYPN